MSAVLSARGLVKRHGKVTAVAGVDLDLREGEILCLLGPSGCGKSSVLRLVAGLEQPDEGELRAGERLLAGAGCFVPPEARRIGLVFQDIALFPHLDAAANVAFGLRGGTATERREQALAELRRFHLSHRASAYPHTLSGGEQQRVAIARALAPRPVALLLDEPFSGLDGELRARIRETVLAGLREARVPVLIVTHDPEEALLLGDRIALMSDGKIQQVGTPQQCYERPVSLGVAALLGRVNALPAVARGGMVESPLGSFPTDLRDGPVQLLIRPEELVLDRTGTAVEVTGMRFGGTYREISVILAGTPLSLRLASSEPVPAGDLHVRVTRPPHIVAPD